MAKNRKCARCGRPSTGLIGSECRKLAVAEAEQFCIDTMNETREEFALACDRDWASDEGLTVEEYRAQVNGSAMMDDDQYFIETMMDHGLWRNRARRGRRRS